MQSNCVEMEKRGLDSGVSGKEGVGRYKKDASGRANEAKVDVLCCVGHSYYCWLTSMNQQVKDY